MWAEEAPPLRRSSPMEALEPPVPVRLPELPELPDGPVLLPEPPVRLLLPLLPLLLPIPEGVLPMPEDALPMPADPLPPDEPLEEGAGEEEEEGEEDALGDAADEVEPGGVAEVGVAEVDDGFIGEVDMVRSW